MNKKIKKYSIEEIDACISILEDLLSEKDQLVALPEEQRIALLRVTGKISRPGRDEIKKRNKAVRENRNSQKMEKNRQAREKTGMVGRGMT